MAIPSTSSAMRRLNATQRRCRCCSRREVDAVMVRGTARLPPPEQSTRGAAVIDTQATAHRTVITSWLGSPRPRSALFAAARLPTYETPDEAIRGS